MARAARVGLVSGLVPAARSRSSRKANWKQGEDVVIAGSVTNEEAKEIFGSWGAPKPYIRIVPQPA